MVAEVAGVNNDLSNKLRSSPSYDEIAEALNVKGFERRSPFSPDQAILGQNRMTLRRYDSGHYATMQVRIMSRFRTN
ncbi:hypothetical protein NC652_002762 [Populus alba x Populus x berolinensis]|nr:hypothetical protein NC652_002762 [Populus alba x Populus x berolinensis]